MTSPANGSTLARATAVTFAWTPIDGAVTYLFEYTGPNRQFANPNGTAPDPVNGLGGAGGGFPVSGTSFRVTLGAGIPAGSYQVRVMAMGPSGPLGHFSGAVTVTVPSTPSPGPSPPAPPPSPPGKPPPDDDDD
jgi:hypothetical protein